MRDRPILFFLSRWTRRRDALPSSVRDLLRRRRWQQRRRFPSRVEQSDYRRAIYGARLSRARVETPTVWIYKSGSGGAGEW